MDNTKIRLVILIAIIVVLAIAVALCMGWMSKTDTQINVLSNDSLSPDDQIKVRLQTQDNQLASKTIYFKFIDENGNVKEYSVETKEHGFAELKLNDLDGGNYTVNVTFEGDNNYNPTSTSQKLEIKEPVVEEEPIYEEPAVSTDSPSSASSNSDDDGYWETSMDADFEYHTEYESDGEFRQYDRSGRLVGSSHDEDQEEVANNVGRRI